ncbi:hypothetical protein FB451DRAFT_1031889 [Mycena latifolia]|nr:hypothetical protein FB451DRAFT_1031889 [Mycena latifolia]
MHRCLDVAELVDLICSYSSRGSLAALARTCKTLQGSALDRLWHDQYTLRNILGCMPPGLLDSSDALQRLLRPIVAADWRRAIKYAGRVRSLFILAFDDIMLGDVLPALSLSLPGNCLFPNLRDLEWYPYEDESLYMRILLTPTIRDISFSCSASYNELSLLPALARTCTALKRLAIRMDCELDSVPKRSAMSDFLQMLRCTESLRLDIPDFAALEHIGRLSTLTDLTITSFDFEVSSAPYIPAPHFTTLQHLTFEAGDIHQTTDFLHLCSDMPLVRLEATFPACPPMRVMYKFCTALKASCSHGSLCSLELDTDGDIGVLGDADKDAYLIGNDSIQTLFCFRNLTSISIDSGVGFDFDDSILSELACAWPNAKTLLLRSGWQRRPRNTLECLCAFAQHCPDLEKLHLTLDAAQVIPAGHRRLSQRRLKHLEVPRSPISALTLDVARVISALFPGLQRLSSPFSLHVYQFDPEMDELRASSQRWKEVKAYLPVVAAIREEGRALALEELGA